MIKILFFREILLSLKNKTILFVNFLFLFSFILIAALTIGPDFEILYRIAPALIWIASFFTLLLHIEFSLKQDHINGCLEQFLLGQNFFYKLQILHTKILAHWFAYIFPLLFAIPLMGFMLNLSLKNSFFTLFLILLSALPLIALGIFATILTMTIKHSTLLTAIIILPFSIPILIFALNTNIAFISQSSYQNTLYILFGLCGIYWIFCPIFAVYALHNLQIND